MVVLIAGLLRSHRNGRFDRGAAARPADERQAAAEPRRSLAHREQAKVLT
jgi:hypothetical protein